MSSQGGWGRVVSQERISRLNHAVNQAKMGHLVLKTPSGASPPTQSGGVQTHRVLSGQSWRVLGGKNRCGPKMPQISSSVCTCRQGNLQRPNQRCNPTSTTSAQPLLVGGTHLTACPGPRIEPVDFTIIGTVCSSLMVHILSPFPFFIITA